MRFHFYNGFHDNGMECNMSGFILQNGNNEPLLDPLNFPTNSPVIEEDHFVPKGDFWGIPPTNPIQCTNATIKFLPVNFSGPPPEDMVRNMK